MKTKLFCFPVIMQDWNQMILIWADWNNQDRHKNINRCKKREQMSHFLKELFYLFTPLSSGKWIKISFFPRYFHKAFKICTKLGFKNNYNILLSIFWPFGLLHALLVCVTPFTASVIILSISITGQWRMDNLSG